jgi:predicted transport protein
LERLTNAGREKVQTHNLTVEHVLPQNPKLSAEWRDTLGPDWKDVQARCLHKLGNLTLTAFNPEFSDRPFAEKKAKDPGGYAQSPVWLNQSIAACDIWGEPQITDRSQRLADRALSVWKPLQVDAAALAQAELDEARERSSAFRIDDAPWDEASRRLFDALRGALLTVGNEVVELPYAKSIVYRGPEWFVEVMPRVRHLLLRLAPDPEELAGISPKVEDADEWKFIVNSKVEGGSLFSVRSETDLGVAKQLVNRAFELTCE